MSKKIFSLIIIACISYLPGAPASGESLCFKNGSYLVSMATEMERLEYRETLPESGIKSDSVCSNLNLSLIASREFGDFFAEIGARLPVYSGTGDEKWSKNDALKQSNTLKYSFTRISSLAGFHLSNFVNPYVGILFSFSKQERYDFYLKGAFLDTLAREEVMAMNLLMGVRGGKQLSSKIKVDYDGNFFLPISSRVTNTALPGWAEDGKRGYGMEAKAGIHYRPLDKFEIGGSAAMEFIHWQGGDWNEYEGGLVKWPENETLGITFSLYASCFF